MKSYWIMNPLRALSSFGPLLLVPLLIILAVGLPIWFFYRYRFRGHAHLLWPCIHGEVLLVSFGLLLSVLSDETVARIPPELGFVAGAAGCLYLFGTVLPGLLPSGSLKHTIRAGVYGIATGASTVLAGLFFDLSVVYGGYGVTPVPWLAGAAGAVVAYLVSVWLEAKLVRPTDLHRLVAADDVAGTEDLLAVQPERVHATDARGWTPLHWAVHGDHGEIFVALLCHQPPLDAQDHRGWTPLHLAVLCRRQSMVRALLEAGADPNARTGDGRSALDLARQRRLADIIALLAQHGARRGAVGGGGHPGKEKSRRKRTGPGPDSGGFV